LLALTTEGEEVAAALRQRLADAVDHRLVNWLPAERQLLAELMPRFVDAIARDSTGP